jgi:iron complex transport system substrate-binding protein
MPNTICPTPGSPRRSRPALLLVAVALVAALLAGACGSSASSSSNEESTDTTGGESTGSAFPVSIEHKFGTTEIDAEPTRVVSVGYTDQDVLLALGVVPIAIRDWYGDQPNAVWPWAQDLLEGAEPVVLPSTEPSLEQIAGLNPDLIVGVSSGMTEEQYDLLSQIAPTIPQTADQPDYQETWQTGTRLIGQAVGKSDLAEELIAEVEADFASYREANPQLEGQEGTVSYVMSPTEVGAYASGDARSRILTELGLVIPAEIDELAGGQFYSQFSLEELKRLDRDVLVWITYEPEIVEQIKASPLRSQMTAVAEGREVFLTEMEAGAASFSSVLSLPYFLETFVPKLVAAADGDPSTSAE